MFNLIGLAIPALAGIVAYCFLAAAIILPIVTCIATWSSPI